MPLTDELGNEALRRDDRHLGRSSTKLNFSGGQFEAWLSRRAEAQPYESAAEALASKAVFARATELITEVLDERVERVLADPMPSWLGELLSLWHLRQSHVLTFNYDTLVECAFETMRLWDWRQGSSFQWGSLINYSPEGKAGHSIGEFDGSGEPHPSFRLWKLHGSLNWRWVPGDSTGSTVRRVRLPGVFGHADPVTAEEAHWRAPGREPFIVPPAALKSGYYSNPVTREIWQRGFDALRSADRITLIGYSVPLTDLSTSGMLAEALASSPAKEINIVDLESGGGAIADRINKLGAFNTRVVTGHTGVDSVQRYVNHLLDEAASALVEKLRDSSVDIGSESLYVNWGDIGAHSQQVGRAAAICGFEWDSASRTLELHAEDLGPLAAATRSRSGEEESPLPLTLRDLTPHLADATHITISTPGSSDARTVIECVERVVETGHGDGRWLQLVAAGEPPR